MTTDKLVFQTPWRNIQGYECRITSDDHKDYSFQVGNPHNISISGFTSSVAANIAMRERVTALKALSSTEEEAKKPDNSIEVGKRGKRRGKKTEPVEEPVGDVATVIPIESKRRRGRPPKQSYTFDAKEDAELVPVIPSGEDW